MHFFYTYLVRIASIDCGSNSFHLLICDVLPHDQLVVLNDEKSMLYLGAEVASNGEISQASLLRARRVMRHYKNLISHRKAEIVTCVATSAMRSAKNGDQVVQALSKTLGHRIDVISGDREAQLIFRGISALSTLPESRVLAVDMGGGSLEVMAGQRYGLEYAKSVPLGASRLARELRVSDPLTSKDIKAIENKCDVFFQDFARNYPASLFKNIVASSGTLTTLITMARAKADGHSPGTMTSAIASKDEMMQIANDLIELSINERKQLSGYDKDRSEFLPTAAVIAKKIIGLASEKATWMISPYALREGIALTAADELLQTPPSSKTETASATVNMLVEKIKLLSPDSTIINHSEHVKDLSTQLFNATKPLHKLKDNDRSVLRHAAMLHDIGETISHSKHDQHGAYILSSIPLAGFTPEEAALLRGIVRWHRSKDPKKSDKFAGHFNEMEFHKVSWLSALLRIADGADSSKRQLVNAAKLSIKPDAIFIKLVSDKDIELEIYSARRKRLLLEKISGKDVVIQQEFSGQAQKVQE